ncbi:MAG: hypothetical protein ACI4MT_01435 [Christensenellales bacterium]
MKGYRKTVLSIILILLSALLTCGLLACNKSKEPTEREKAINEFKDGLMLACDDEWNYSMSAEKVNSLSNEAHYIYQKSLTDIYANALDKSDVRVQKINILASELKSNDELKRLIRNEKFDSTKLVAILDEIGFTGTDYTGIIICVLQEWIKNGYTLAENVTAKLTDRKAELGVDTSAEKKNEFSEVIGKVEILKNGLTAVENDKEQILDDIDSVESDLNTLIDFAVNLKNSLDVSSLASFGNIISEGQITSKSVDEVYTYVQGLVGAIKNLSAELEQSKLETLSATINKLKTVFGAIHTSDSFFNAINNYLAIGSTCIDYVPLVTYVAVNFADGIDKQLVKSFLEIYSGAFPKENYGLVVGKFMTKFYGATTAESLKEQISSLSSQMSGDIDKAGYAWMVINAALEESELNLGDISEYAGETERKRLSALVVYSLVYRQYWSNIINFDLRAKINSDITLTATINQEISWFKSIKKYLSDGELNPDGIGSELIATLSQYEDAEGNPSVKTVYAWAKAIIDAADEFFGKVATDCSVTITRAIEKIIDKFYANAGLYTELANKYDNLNGELITAEDPEFSELCTLYNDANIEYVIGILGLVK